MKMVVRKQNWSKRFANGFIIEFFYQGFYFHIEIVIIKINKWAPLFAQ